MSPFKEARTPTEDDLKISETQVPRGKKPKEDTKQLMKLMVEEGEDKAVLEYTGVNAKTEARGRLNSLGSQLRKKGVDVTTRIRHKDDGSTIVVFEKKKGELTE